MNSEEVKWKNTNQRFVAFLDIMGFKDMISRKSHTEMLKIMQAFQPSLAVIEKLSKVQTNNPTRVLSFSDSIILLSNDNSLESARELLFYVGWVLQTSIRKGIPTKGAIAYGKQTSDFKRDLHFGRPLIDAYELQHELWLYGCVLHHTMEQHLIDNQMIKELEPRYLLNYNTPFKQTGDIKHYIVDWFGSDRNEQDSALKRLYRLTSGPTRRYVDNTLKYFEFAKQKRESEFKKRIELEAWIPPTGGNSVAK